MVFKGAGGRFAREISETIEDVGGDLNAATDRDNTSFMATVMAEHVPLGVEIIADMILRPHFDPLALEREKDDVLQELGEADRENVVKGKRVSLSVMIGGRLIIRKNKKRRSI